QQIKLLEQQCEARFVVRIGQGVELTERGQVFIDAIRSIIAQAEEIESNFKVKSNEKKASFLAVGGSGSHAVIVLPEILRAFKQNHPWVQFAVQCDVSEAVEAGVQRELGVGILYRQTVEAVLKNRDLKILHVPDLAKIRTKSFFIYNKCKPLSGIARDFLHALRESRISKVES